MAMNAPIRNISDTALWVAMYRAFESERPDALFCDPHARRLAGERGEAIVHSLPRGRTLAWPMIVRTAVMDEIIVRCVSEGARTVFDLAAGLDARPFRLALIPIIGWIVGVVIGPSFCAGVVAFHMMFEDVLPIPPAPAPGPIRI